MLKRNHLSFPRQRRRKGPPYEQPFLGCDGPNAVWSADFKGWFTTGDGRRCDPFTLSDNYSRYLLRCQVVWALDYEHVRPLMEAAFREFGLPLAIRTDNGTPFATTTVGGLSRLSIWLLKLGVWPERIQPGRPAQNGRHERMHRTLKDYTAKPPKSSLRAQQKAFDEFQKEYNHERPHRMLNGHTPAELYRPSSRPYPHKIPELTYPDDFVLRRVFAQGDFKWRGHQAYLSETLAGELVGFRRYNERLWTIYFGPVRLATFDQHTGKLSRRFRRKHWLKSSPNNMKPLTGASEVSTMLPV